MANGARSRLQFLIDATWRGGSAVQRAGSDFGNLGSQAQSSSVQMAAVEQRSLLVQRKMSELGREVAQGTKSIGAASLEFSQFEEGLAEIPPTTERSRRSFQTFIPQIVAVAATFTTMAFAVRRGLSAIEEATELELIEQRFDRLAESVGTTGDALLIDLQRATRGTLDTMELMAAATQILSLRLAQTEDEAVRLTRVVAGLGAKMNEVVLALANQTTRRFDQIGIAVEGFSEKLERLEAQGIDTERAFTLAFLEQGEEQLQFIGERADFTAGRIDILQSSFRELGITLKQDVAEGAEPAITAISDLVIAANEAEVAVGDLADAAKPSAEETAEAIDAILQAAQELEEAPIGEALVAGIVGADRRIADAALDVAVEVTRSADSIEEARATLEEYGFETQRAAAFHDQFVINLGNVTVGWNEYVEALREARLESAQYTEEQRALRNDTEQIAAAERKATEAARASADQYEGRRELLQRGSQATQELAEETGFLSEVYGGNTQAIGENSIELAAAEAKASLLSRKVAELGREVAEGNLSLVEANRLLEEFKESLEDSAAGVDTLLPRYAELVNGVNEFEAEANRAVQEITERNQALREQRREQLEAEAEALEEARRAQERYWRDIDSILSRAVSRQDQHFDDLADAFEELREARDAAAADPTDEALVSDLESAIERVEQLADEGAEAWEDMVLEIITTTGGFDEVAAQFAVSAGIISQAQADAMLQARDTAEAIEDIGLAVDQGAISPQEGAELFRGIQEGTVSVEDVIDQLSGQIQDIPPQLQEAQAAIDEAGGTVQLDSAQVSDAVQESQTLEQTLADAAGVEWMVSLEYDEVSQALVTAQALEEQLLALTQGEYNIDVNLNSGGDTDIPGFNLGLEHGSGGWLQVPPGFREDSFLVGLSSGEWLNVLTPQQAREAGGGGTVVQDNSRTVLVANSREAAALALANTSVARRRRLDGRMGVKR